jgi:hypothetical protein
VRHATTVMYGCRFGYDAWMALSFEDTAVLNGVVCVAPAYRPRAIA